MKYYFTIQYRRIYRHIDEFGLNPFLGLFILGFLFYGLSSSFFEKTEFAKYLVLITALSFLFKMSEINRCDFLLTVFGDNKTRKIRIVENLIICFPFSILLFYQNIIWESIMLLIASIFMASFSIKTNFNFIIPTPFYKKPFEFTVGFRKTFYLFPIAYILTFIAISVDNLNLGIFAMLLVYLVSLSYYSKPENEFFVWSYSTSPQKFLIEKLKIATKNSFLLALPIIISLLAFYPTEIDLILMFLLIGILFLWTIILAKYSAYPNEMNLPEGILIALCIYFPPILLALMPFFYNKSVQKLKKFLR